MKRHTDTKAIVCILICAEIPLLKPAEPKDDKQLLQTTNSDPLKYSQNCNTSAHQINLTTIYSILNKKKKRVSGNLQESLMLLSRVPDVDILYFSLKSADKLKAGLVSLRLQLKWGWRTAKRTSYILQPLLFIPEAAPLWPGMLRHCLLRDTKLQMQLEWGGKQGTYHSHPVIGVRVCEFCVKYLPSSLCNLGLLNRSYTLYNTQLHLWLILQLEN